MLERLIDHAALFPPANMAMSEALAEDARVRSGAESWIVGRFVVPASRLADVGDESLPLSVVLDAELAPGNGRIEAVEVPPGGDAASALGLAPEVYVEVPFDGALHEGLERCATLGAAAKLRCGGRSVPSVEQFADAVRCCRELALRFKATAGLHHPVRHDREHGFLNLLAAVAFGDEQAALAERDASTFTLTREAFTWRGRSADVHELVRVRERFGSFGSCSVAEPVQHLRALRFV